MQVRSLIRKSIGLSLAASLSVGGAALAGPFHGRRQSPPPRRLLRALGARRLFAPPIVGVGGQAQSDPAAAALLRRMLASENNLALSGTQVTVVSGGATSEQHVLRNGARALRLDYLRPPQMKGEQIVDNGRNYYHFLPEQHRWETQPSQVQSLRVRVPQVLGQVRRGELRVQMLGQDTVAGRACSVIGVTASGNSPSARKFWIDPTNGAQLKIEQYNAAGELLSVSYYTSVTYNPPLNGHSFDPPSGGGTVSSRPGPQPTVPTEAQVGFAVLQPSFLPRGFHFQSASVSMFHGKKVASLRYANGLNVLSLFETPDNGRTAINRFPRPGVLVARRGSVKMVLVSSLGRKVLENVVNSLR